MKRKLLFLLAALLTSVGMWAQDEGTYYIQNVGTGKWLGPANSWETQASVLDHADKWVLAKISDGVYTLESVVSNGESYYYLNGTYCDGGSTTLTFTAVAGQANTYNISTGENAYLKADDGIVANNGADATDDNAKWKLFSADDMIAAMASATSESGVDATWKILNHNLSRNNRNKSSWSKTNTTDPTTSEGEWGGAVRYSVESYQKTFNYSQSLESLPNGLYGVRVNGFYRQDGSNVNLPYVYAGTSKKTLPLRTGSENNMQTAAVSFVAGNYLSDEATCLVTNGNLTIGVKSEGNSCWAIFKNFHLEYYGNAISYYDPVVFTSGTQADAGEWKYYDVNDGWYKIASNAAITLYYTQHDSDDADNTESVSISKDGFTYLKLSEGKIYFKSSANATLTLTEGFVANDDITKFFLTNPNFTGNADGWEGSPVYKSNNAEMYNTTFDVYQTAANLPAGYYWIKAQAFDRETNNAATYESATSVSKAYLYAGNAMTLVKRIYDDASTSQLNSGTDELSFVKGETTVYIPNMPGAGEKYFDANLYDNELLIYHSGGDLRIGIKKYVKTNYDWCLFDNFRIIYAGSTPSNGTDMTSLITNPSFENGTTDWSGSSGFYGRTRSNGELNNMVGDKYALLQVVSNREAYQTIRSLLGGKYILSANARADANAGTVSLNMGDFSTSIPVGQEASIYTVAYENAENDDVVVKISASGGSDNRRVYFDNFTLTYYETLPDVSISDLTSSAMAADVRAALTSASSTYSGSKTAANYNALQTAIVNAKVSIAEYAAKTGTDADWTGIIANPSFETGTPNYYKGWTVEVSSGSSTSDDQHRYKADGMGGEGEGSWRFFIWTENAGAATVKQTVSELPSGNYKLSAYMASGAGDVFTLSAGSTNSKVIASDGNATLVEVYFNQASKGNIEISATHSDSWFDLDNFHLTSNPTLPESITGVSGNMNSTVASAQTTAVNAYNAESGQTFANMLAAQTAMNNARASILVYNDISNLVTTYAERVQNNLDAAGKAAYDASTVEGKITSGTYATAAEAEADLKAAYIVAVKAQTTANTDMTEAITNPSFESATGVSTTIAGWTNEANKTLQTQSNKGPGDTFRVGNYYAERWHSTGDKNIFQMITGLHAGAYILTAKAYAGDATAKVYALVGETEYKIDVTATEDYSVLFNYDGTSTLKIGFFGNMGNDANAGWICVDNFRLTYAGETQPDLPLYTTELMNATAKTNANTAISTYNANKTSENYTAAESAITVAEASKTAYESASLEGYKSRMGELLIKTNVYTTAAYNKWYANVEDNYTNGVYTDAEVVTLTAAGACQGAAETAHKKANRIDDVLLSSWTIGGEQCSDYNKNLYINTWSVEGNSDGSGFQTPFFEYWTSDGNSLGEATMVGTVTGLEASTEYSVDIWARVRQTNNQEKVADKITLQVGSGDAVDIAAGTQHTTHGTSDFYNGHFTAVGYTDGSGDLTITISVAAESNVSWLSFKDVAYNRQNVSGSVETYSGVYNDNETIAPTAEAPIVDISGATFNGTLTASYASNANGFIIATAAQKAAMGNPKNVIVGNTCDELVITDGVDITIPAALTTATSATYSRSIAASSNFGTICLPYDVESDDDIQYYTASAIYGDVLKLETVDDVPAGTPAIFKKKTENATSITVTSSNADVVRAASEEGETAKLVGTFEEITIDGTGGTPAAEDCYYIKSNQFWQGNENFIIGAFRAYLTTSAGARLTIQIDEETAVNTLKELDANQELKDGKYLINGRIVIVKDGQSFYVDGKLK